MGSKYLYYVSGDEVIPMFDPQLSLMLHLVCVMKENMKFIKQLWKH